MKKAIHVYFRFILILAGIMLHYNLARGAPGTWKIAGTSSTGSSDELIMVHVDSLNNHSIYLNYSLPNPQVEELGMTLEGKISSRIILGNAPLTGREGEPVLPVIPAKVIIPAGQTIDTISVIRGEKIEVPGKYFIEHQKGYYPFVPDWESKQVEPDPRIYLSDQAFPGKTHDFLGIQRKRGVEIALFNLYPITYHPQTGRVYTYETISVQIITKEDPARDKPKLRTRIDGLNALKIGVENPEALATYQDLSLSTPTLPYGICNPAESYQYVIVTGIQIRDAETDVTVYDLIAHKQSRGISATLVTIEEIYAQYPGVDNAERLRNFIIDAYNNWETEYILLGGDTNIIPLRYLYAEGTNIPSDLYYQCLDGNYNSDNDDYWGESTDGPGGTDIDLMAEVYIGRASAESPEEMANFVFKTITYENELDNAPYLRRVLIAGEYLGSQFGPGEFAYAMPYMEEIRLGSQASGYTTEGFAACPDFIVDTLYDYDYDWPAQEILDKINSNDYGIINHLGHANYNYVMKFYNYQADSLRNTNYLFAYSQGCLPGNFEEDCIAEHLTTSHRYGMVAVVFNSRYGWGRRNDSRETLDGPSQRFDRQFWDAYFGEYIFNLGHMNADSHEDNIWCIHDDYIRWCFYSTNLLGDPQTVLRGGVSESHFQNEPIPEGTHQYTRIKAGPNVWIEAGTEVTLIAQDSIIVSNNFVVKEDAIVTFKAAQITSENGIIIKSGALVIIDATDFLILGPDVTIETGAEVILKAGNYIRILPDFTAAKGCRLEACTLNECQTITDPTVTPDPPKSSQTPSSSPPPTTLTYSSGQPSKQYSGYSVPGITSTYGGLGSWGVTPSYSAFTGLGGGFSGYGGYSNPISMTYSLGQYGGKYGGFSGPGIVSTFGGLGSWGVSPSYSAFTGLGGGFSGYTLPLWDY